jgi:hypothetical protein
MMRIGKGSSIVALALSIGAGVASADEVLFNNGDKLSGKIVKVEGGKITIKSKLVGEVTADMKEVKTFATDQPVELRTKGGQRVTAMTTAAGEGGKGQRRADWRTGDGRRAADGHQVR